MPFKRITGGSASRAEVYGLFIAAIVVIGGGVSGAIALTNNDPAPIVASPTEATATQEPTDSENASPAEASSSDETSTSSNPGSITTPGSGSPTQSAPIAQESPSASTCEYTPAEQDYYNSIRTTKQAAVDQAQAHVDNVNSWIASNTAHLEELLAAPYRPIEVFQWKADGTPYVWRVDSNEEIAFERQRITDNQSELVRAEEALRQAIADRDLIPGC